MNFRLKRSICWVVGLIVVTVIFGAGGNILISNLIIHQPMGRLWSFVWGLFVGMAYGVITIRLNFLPWEIK